MEGFGALPQLRPGERLGKYVVERELGRGAMGVVYLAVQENLGRYVALKVCPPNARFSRVRREALAVARLAHPHIVQVYDVEEFTGFQAIVFEYLSGGSLADRLTSQGPLPIAEALRIADEVASALEAAHRRGLIHQDVKPPNILFDEEGRAKLADFGIAVLAAGLASFGLSAAGPQDGTGRRGDTSSLVSAGPEEPQAPTADRPGAHPGQAGGTALYAAPEQWRGGPVDGRTDLYALAVVLFQSVTGELPFRGESLAELGRAVLSDPIPQLEGRAPEWSEMDLETRSRFLVAGQVFFAQALAKVPEARFSTARRFREGLRRLGAEAGVALPDLASPVSLSEADLSPEMGAGLSAEAPAGALVPATGHRVAAGATARLSSDNDPGSPDKKGPGSSSPSQKGRSPLTSTTVSLSFLVLDHVSWRGNFWERLRSMARAHLEDVLARVQDSGLRRRLALALARLRVRTLARELAEVQARSRRLRGYGEGERERADAWQRRASAAVARADEAGAQLAASREAEAREVSRRFEERAEKEEAAALVLRQVHTQAGQDLEEAQRLRDLAGSGEALVREGGAGRTAWGRGGKWALRVLASAAVIWLAWALLAPTHTSEPNAERGRQALPSAFSPFGMMAEAREDHTATVLPDGRVLVVGGRNERGRALAATEVCDPGSGWQVLLGPSLRVPRFNHTAALLGDGSVLVVGGEAESQRSDALSSAERLVVAAGARQPDAGAELVGALLQARCRHAAVTLRDGSVLVLGGQDEAGHVLASVERYLAGEGRFAPGPTLGVARRDAAVALLADGSVLVAGGNDEALTPLASLELLRPGASQWEEVGSLQEPRYEATVTALPDGRALVVGGGRSPRQRLDSIELFDPLRRESRVVAHLRQPRRVHTATLVTVAGQEAVLVVGGAGGSEAASSELVVPRARPKAGARGGLAGTRGGEETWEVWAGPRLRTARGNHAAVVLPDGGLLIIGGYDPLKGTALRSMELLPGAPKGGTGSTKAP